jgi:malate/lactate dehydrogenase
MTKVIIIGSGNAAQHLITAFQNAENLGTEIELVQVYSRRLGTVSHLLDHAKITDDLNSLLEADLYIIAVSDAVIAEIAAQLPFKNRLVVHTGSVSLNALDDNNRKVFLSLANLFKTRSRF